MERKKIAFFGDSFVAVYGAWILTLCKELNLEVVHLGKHAADPLFIFDTWKTINDAGNDPIDYCIYCHSENFRPYVPKLTPGITGGTLARSLEYPDEMPKQWLACFSNDRPRLMRYLNVLFDYITEVREIREAKLKTMVVPLGVDRYIKTHNSRFKKIIHLWGFAQHRGFNSTLGNWVAAPADWDFIIESGSSIYVDLSTLSYLDPGLDEPKREKMRDGSFWDQRHNHFTDDATPFINDMIKYLMQTEENKIIDFRPYVKYDSVWDDYVNAWGTIKNEFNQPK